MPDDPYQHYHFNDPQSLNSSPYDPTLARWPYQARDPFFDAMYAGLAHFFDAAEAIYPREPDPSTSDAQAQALLISQIMEGMMDGTEEVGVTLTDDQVTSQGQYLPDPNRPLLEGPRDPRQAPLLEMRLNLPDTPKNRQFYRELLQEAIVPALKEEMLMAARDAQYDAEAWWPALSERTSHDREVKHEGLRPLYKTGELLQQRLFGPANAISVNWQDDHLTVAWGASLPDDDTSPGNVLSSGQLHDQVYGRAEQRGRQGQRVPAIPPHYPRVTEPIWKNIMTVAEQYISSRVLADPTMQLIDLNVPMTRSGPFDAQLAAPPIALSDEESAALNALYD